MDLAYRSDLIIIQWFSGSYRIENVFFTFRKKKSTMEAPDLSKLLETALQQA